MKFRGREIEYRKEWWAKNKDRQRKYKEKRKPQAADDWRKTTYGLTPEQWIKLSKNGCGICGSCKKLVVDHCHKTGKVRGALCGKHNTALGQFNDDPKILRKALQWLEKHK